MKIKISMEIELLVKKWFRVWKEGDYQNIPVEDTFKHTSPYGTIEGKENYLRLVAANVDKFLGNEIVIRDEIYNQNRACVRYTIINKDFTMEVSEWLYKGDGKLTEIIAYYNIEGEISETRQLANPN